MNSGWGYINSLEELSDTIFQKNYLFNNPFSPELLLSPPPTGILSIATIPWDDMTMTMHHGLASRESNIEPDIIPGRFRGFFDNLFTVINQCHNCIFFLTGHVEKIRDMAEWDNQHMPSGYRIPVPTGIV
jgi:hypothetical protein